MLREFLSKARNIITRPIPLVKLCDVNQEKIPLWRTWHCLTVFGPYSEFEITPLVLHDRARNLLTKEGEIEFLKERKKQYEKIQHLETVSGFYSAQAAILSHRYNEFVGDVRSFSLCYYFNILRHTFAPADRLREHSVYTPSSNSVPLDLFSNLSQISYNIRACLLYSGAHFLGRRKYLRYFNHSYILEIFKGLEYLAKLYYLKIDTRNIAKTFKDFIVETTAMNEEEAEALWEFRCGLVHRGSLYNVNNNRVYRFGYSWENIGIPLVRKDSRPNPMIKKGKKYLINIFSLYPLFMQLKAHVHQHMLDHYTEYATHENFHKWVRWYWTLQYLPDEKEYEDCFKTQPDLSANLDLVAKGNAFIYKYDMVKAAVRRDYILYLRWNDFKEDIHSRFRDFFSIKR